MNTIFYFTATGNSLRVAQIIAENLENVRLQRITEKLPMTYVADSKEIVGVIYPVICGNAPEIVRRFVRGIELPEDAYFFGIATHGGHAVLGKEQIAQIINEKQHHNCAFFDIEMIHNGAFVAQLPDTDTIRKVTDAAYETAQKLAKRINNKETMPIPDAHELIEAAKERPMAKMVVFGFHPNEMGKTYFINGECIKCGICVQVCPVNNISLTENGPVWGEKCEMCNACLQWCSQKIIQFSKTDVMEHTSIGNERFHNPDIKLSDILVRSET